MLSRRHVLLTGIAASLGANSDALAQRPGSRAIIAGIRWRDTKAQFFFNDGTYVRYDLAANRADDGYPLPVHDRSWPGMGAYGGMIMAACAGPNNKAYFFLNNGQYLRFDIATNRTDPGFPKPIDDRNWPGLGAYATQISAALNWRGTKIQFFLLDGTYLRYDIATNRADSGYPRPITDSSWPGLGRYARRMGPWIDWQSKAYSFLDNGSYLRYDIATDRLDPGYPRPIAADWPGLL